MDINKYKSLAVDHKCYEAINKLTKHQAPGVTLSRAQVIRMLVKKETKKLNGKLTAVSKKS